MCRRLRRPSVGMVHLMMVGGILRRPRFIAFPVDRCYRAFHRREVRKVQGRGDPEDAIGGEDRSIVCVSQCTFCGARMSPKRCRRMPRIMPRLAPPAILVSCQNGGGSTPRTADYLIGYVGLASQLDPAKGFTLSKRFSSPMNLFCGV
jgi:hypothetical protein